MKRGVRNMSCERCAQNSCNRMPVTKGNKSQCEGQTQVYNKCYDINGGNYHIVDTNICNNYYNRYNHYYVTQRNITTDYVTDYNVFHYNQENIYNGCYTLGSYNSVANGQGYGQNGAAGWNQGYGQNGAAGWDQGYDQNGAAGWDQGCGQNVGAGWGQGCGQGCGQNVGTGWGQCCEHKCMPKPCRPCCR